MHLEKFRKTIIKNIKIIPRSQLNTQARILLVIYKKFNPKKFSLVVFGHLVLEIKTNSNLYQNKY